MTAAVVVYPERALGHWMNSADSLAWRLLQDARLISCKRCHPSTTAKGGTKLPKDLCWYGGCRVSRTLFVAGAYA